MESGDILFFVFAGAAIAGAIGTVSNRNPVYSALCLMGSFLSMAILFLLLDAPFIAAMHVVVYTGAILVLFLFVIMLLNLQPDEVAFEYPTPVRVWIGALCAVAAVLIIFSITTVEFLPFAEPPDGFGSIHMVGEAVFERYILPFELVAILILSATLGGLILGRPRA